MTVKQGGKGTETPFDDLDIVMVLGAAKCGTTSLCDWLAAQPGVCLSAPKEPAFFPLEFERGFSRYWSEYFEPVWSGEGILAEGQNRNLYLPFVPPRIQALTSNPKLVVILRDPVARAVAHWWHRVRAGTETKSLEDALRDDEARINAGVDFTGPDGAAAWKAGVLRRRPTLAGHYRTYLDSGHYAVQLQRYIDTFGRDALHVMFLEEVTADPTTELASLSRFIGVTGPKEETFQWSNRGDARPAAPRLKDWAHRAGLRKVVPADLRLVIRRLTTRRSPRPEVSEVTARLLNDYYKEHNKQLERLLARELPPTWH